MLYDERLVFALRFHRSKILEPIATAALSFLLVIAISVAGGPDIFWLIWLVVAGRGLWRYLTWQDEWFVATDKRLLLLFGLVTHTVAMAPLAKVTDLSYVRTPVGQLLGYGKFVFETAGQDQAFREISWVPHPHDTYQLLCQTLFGPKVKDPDEDGEMPRDTRGGGPGNGRPGGGRGGGPGEGPGGGTGGSGGGRGGPGGATPPMMTPAIRNVGRGPESFRADDPSWDPTRAGASHHPTSNDGRDPTDHPTWDPTRADASDVARAAGGGAPGPWIGRGSGRPPGSPSRSARSFRPFRSVSSARSKSASESARPARSTAAGGAGAAEPWPPGPGAWPDHGRRKGDDDPWPPGPGAWPEPRLRPSAEDYAVAVPEPTGSSGPPTDPDVAGWDVSVEHRAPFVPIEPSSADTQPIDPRG